MIILGFYNTYKNYVWKNIIKKIKINKLFLIFISHFKLISLF